jgi:hypothetical protein
MKYRMINLVFFMIWISAGTIFAADEKTSLETQAVPQSLGAQAGEAARELKVNADEGFSTGAAKVAESSRKLEAEAQDAFKILQQQWEAFVKQLQEKNQQLQKQLQAQWQDFNKSFNQPSKS